MGLSQASTTQVEIRPARWADRDDIAAVLARGFAEEELHAHMFSGGAEHEGDRLRAWREAFEERWWDYSKIWLVAIVPSRGEGGEEGPGRSGGGRRIVGVAEWQRTGPGWEAVWGSWGYLDPRNTAHHIISLLHQGHNWWSPNRSLRQPTAEDPHPLTKPTFGARIAPFMANLFPHTIYWELCTLAVDSSQRRRGVGAALVKTGLGRAAQESLPAGVVTAKGTEEFYESCGFTHCVGVASEIQIEGLTNPLVERGLGGGAVLWTELPARKDSL